MESHFDRNAAHCVVAAVGIPCFIRQVRADDGFDFEGSELADLHAAAEISGVQCRGELGWEGEGEDVGAEVGEVRGEDVGPVGG